MMASIADQAVEALAMVSSIGNDLTNEDPCRRLVRNMKRLAERDMEACFLRATDLAYQAQQIKKDFEAHIKGQA